MPSFSDGRTRGDETRDERRPGQPLPTPAGPARDLPFVDPSHYEIAGEHARGGLGRVLRARDRRLERTVALKELAHGPSARTAQRFVREALVTARLQHPSIVPVYEAGRWPSGDPFYAMKLVSGSSLDEAIEKRPTLDARLALLPHVLAVAEAVAYAHAEGVIHRDLKPANVMLGAFGETQVVDWGLAKDRRLTDASSDASAEDDSLYAQAHAEMTRVGSVVGTPAYMPPEQARGEEVDERADVYAIGAMLYHLLAAEPPFEGAPDTVVARVAKGPPTPLVERAPEAPRDLVAIVDKAMARDAQLRYPTAKELAQDLSRFLTGQLVGARAYGRMTLLARWLRRNRTPVAIASVLLTLLAVTASLSAVRIVRERNVARARSAELVLTQARSMLERDPTATLAWLKQYPDDGTDWISARNIAADAYSRGVATQLFSEHPESIESAALSADGQRAMTASYDLLQVFDTRLGTTLRRTRLAALRLVAFAPDGASVAAGGDDGTVWTMSSTGDEAPRVLGRHGAFVMALAYSSSGERLASGAADGSVDIWDLATGHRVPLVGHTTSVERIAFSGDGRRVKTGSIDGEIREWDAETGEGRLLFSVPTTDRDAIVDIGLDGRVAIATTGRVLLWPSIGGAPREIARGQGAVRVVVALADGSVASGGDDATLRLSRPDGASTMRLGHEHAISAIAASPDGKELASADVHGDIRIWRGDAVRVLRGHARAVTRLAFSKDGSLLLSASDDGTARIWPVVFEDHRIRVATTDVFRVAFADTNVACTSRDGGVRLVNPATGEVRKLGQHTQVAYDLEPLSKRQAVASASWGGEIGIWPLDGGTPTLLAEGSNISDLALSPDERMLATADDDGRVDLWNLGDRTNQLVHRHAGGALNVVFSPDGRQLASTGTDRLAIVHDLATGRDLPLAGNADVVQAAIFSPDSRTLFTSGWDGSVRAWDVHTGRAQVWRGHEGRVRTLALSPDGTWLASGSADRTIRLWNLRNGERRVLSGHDGEVRHLAFSPDGKLIASAGWDETVRLWNLVDGQVTVLRGHVGRVHRVAFSPDGQRLVSAGQDGTVAVWTVRDAAQISANPASLRRWIARTTSAIVARSGLGYAHALPDR